MDRPSKTKIKQAIFVTSAGYPTRYTLVVKSQVGETYVPTYDFAGLNDEQVESIAAANALVRAMREHVEQMWRKSYADSERARRIAAAKRV